METASAGRSAPALAWQELEVEMRQAYLILIPNGGLDLLRGLYQIYQYGGRNLDLQGEPFFSESLPPIMSSITNRLAVLPLSRLEASLVALRMRSGRLVRLPRDSASFTVSMLSRFGLFIAFPFWSGGDEGKGEGVPALIAPPFSNPPRICLTLGSSAARASE